MENRKFQVGDRVKYIPYHAHDDPNHADCEIGYVVGYSASGENVFVRFKGPNGESCSPDQLRKE